MHIMVTSLRMLVTWCEPRVDSLNKKHKTSIAKLLKLSYCNRSTISKRKDKTYTCNTEGLTV